MFYRILKFLVASLLKIYYRKIYTIDFEKVPSEGPLIIACNHPMAFTEACILACFLDRPLHFLVRGDVFKPAWQWFFKLTNQIPIYRFRDGFSNMRRNADSFAMAHQALDENKAILMFPEGNTKLQKKLSRLQKGAAKLAFGAYDEKSISGIKFVPIGVNYENGQEFRSEVFLKVGEPILLEDYLEMYKKDQHDAIASVTEDLYNGMRQLIIHLEVADREPLFNRIVDLHTQSHPFSRWPIVDSSGLRLDNFLGFSEKANQYSDEKVAELERDLEGEKWSQRNIHWRKIIILVFIFPIALLGFLLNALPFYLAKSIAKNKVKQVEFYTPVRMGLCLVFYLIWMVGILLFLINSFGWLSLVLIWLLPLSGYVTIVWYEDYREKKTTHEQWSQLEEML